ncbi:MAG: hypothetical protein R3F53_28640 [Gammaproteobacteria bacterium]
MIQLGGNAIFLSPHDTHLGRGEIRSKILPGSRQAWSISS